jgi:hypothetical protein
MALAGQLNRLLGVAPSPDDREAYAHLLLDKLEDEAFHELYDAQGISSRALAVESVLQLGWPWALHLDPADLEYLRAVKPRTLLPPMWRAMAVVTGVLAALFGLGFLIHF